MGVIDETSIVLGRSIHVVFLPQFSRKMESTGIQQLLVIMVGNAGLTFLGRGGHVRTSRLLLVGQILEFSGIRAEQTLRVVDRNCEVQVLSALEMHCRDSDYFSCHLKQRATTAAGGDGSRDLQVLAAFLLNCADSANYAVRDSRFERERVADRNNLFSYLNTVRIAERECPEVLAVRPD